MEKARDRDAVVKEVLNVLPSLTCWARSRRPKPRGSFRRSTTPRSPSWSWRSRPPRKEPRRPASPSPEVGEPERCQPRRGSRVNPHDRSATGAPTPSLLGGSRLISSLRPLPPRRLGPRAINTIARVDLEALVEDLDNRVRAEERSPFHHRSRISAAMPPTTMNSTPAFESSPSSCSGSTTVVGCCTAEPSDQAGPRNACAQTLER